MMLFAAPCRLAWLALVALGWLGSAAHSPALAQKRLALVIANGAYASLPAVRQAGADADRIAAELGRIGFVVTRADNLARGALDDAITKFYLQLRSEPRDAVGLVYFTGRGGNAGGVNVLLPVDAAPAHAGELERAGVRVDAIVTGMRLAGNLTNIALIDAARPLVLPNAPGRKTAPVAAGVAGLVAVEPPAGAAIQLSAAPRQLVVEGTGTNSNYATALIAALAAPKLGIEDVLRRTRQAVYAATGERQLPWERLALLADLDLTTPAPGTRTTVAPASRVGKAEVAEPGIQECDRLAGALPAHDAGLAPAATIDPARALAACEKAAAEWPSFARFRYQQARALEAAGRREEAAGHYRALSADGHAAAQNALGLLLRDGKGVARDQAEAMRLFRAAAGRGHACAMGNVGWSLQHGLGVKADLREAVSWYRRGAEAGCAPAMRDLGLAYSEGRGVPRRDLTAVVWLRRGADLGDAGATHDLAVMTANGRGTARNEAAAIALYRRAVELGSAQSLTTLGWMTQSGRGTIRDAEEGARLVFQALSKGEPLAVRQVTTHWRAWSREFRIALQRRLAEAGLFKGRVDGTFGRDTARAVEALAARAQRI